MTTLAITMVSWGFVSLFFIPDIGIISYWESIQDPATVDYCFEWEYWNQDLIDPTKPGNGCDGFAYQVFPPLLKVILVLVGGLIIPYAAFKFNKSGAKREAERRGSMIEKYLPYAASYTAAMSAANATPPRFSDHWL